ncbi:MAG: PorV/PorQ family protein [Rhodothermales bacterium]|nr:PorV/PorQ family protein [Rhodothermales bacterium]
MRTRNRTYPSGWKLAAFVVLSTLTGLVWPSGAEAQLLPTLGGDRAGTSGYQFLKIPVDARASALGESVVATAFDATALYWNPALAAYLPGTHVGVHHTAYFVDIRLEYAAATYNIPGTTITVGGSLQTLNSGEMDVTTEFQPLGTGETFNLIDIAAGLTFAQQMTDLFAYGVTTKYVSERVAGLSAETVVFDVGFMYFVGNTGAQLAVSVRNFGFDGRPEGELARTVIDENPVLIEDEFESLTPPTTFHLGFAYEALRNREHSSVLVSSQLNNPNDNAENWNVGVEYGWSETVFLRAGYRFGIEEVTVPSAGVGIAVPVVGSSFRFDYSFNRLERLGNVHRVGLNIGFN